MAFPSRRSESIITVFMAVPLIRSFTPLLTVLLAPALTGCGSLGPVPHSPPGSPPASRTPPDAVTPSASGTGADAGGLLKQGTVISQKPTVLTLSTAGAMPRAFVRTCQSLVDRDWQGECGQVTLGPGPTGAVIWVVEHRVRADGIGAWVVQMYQYDAVAGGYVSRLAGGDSAGAFRSMSVKLVALNGAPAPVLVVGSRPTRSQNVLRYDVVEMSAQQGTMSVIAGRQLENGVIQVGSDLIDFESMYPNGRAAQPEGYAKTFIRYSSAHLVVASAFATSHLPAGPSDL